MNNLRLISTRYIKNECESIVGNTNNVSKLFNCKFINNKINRTNIVKYRFLQSQRNICKRLSNLKENLLLNKNAFNFKYKLNDFKKSESMKKINYLLKSKKIKINKANNKESISFPSIHNLLQKSLGIKVKKINKIPDIKTKTKESIDNNKNKNQKIHKIIIHKPNCFSQRLYYNNKLHNEEEKSIKKIKNNNKCNNSYESKNIIYDNYYKYLDGISSSESNKSRDNKIIDSVNNNSLNKITSTNIKHKVIHIKKTFLNFNKNKLNILLPDSIDNRNKENNEEKINNDFFNANTIKSKFKIKKISLANNTNTHQIN
jgi:hypothetical protein